MARSVGIAPTKQSFGDFAPPSGLPNGGGRRFRPDSESLQSSRATIITIPPQIVFYSL